MPWNIRTPTCFASKPCSASPAPDGSRTGSLKGIVTRIRAGEPIPVFVDRTVSPGYTTDIAAATRELVERRATPGLYHCVNSGATTLG